jgi:hypothetical protein
LLSGITGIEPPLVNTVAQHCTDMRLMRNMCNEYLVFAERLLEPKAPNKTAPGLDASHLFALVAYKSFHLEDFENITRRDSNLDRLYELHQRLVRETIAAKDARKRALVAATRAGPDPGPGRGAAGQAAEPSRRAGGPWQLCRHAARGHLLVPYGTGAPHSARRSDEVDPVGVPQVDTPSWAKGGRPERHSPPPAGRSRRCPAWCGPGGPGPG